MSYTTIFHCDWCRAHEAGCREQADMHDSRCLWNPANKSCVTCADTMCPHHEIGVKPQRNCVNWQETLQEGK
jgi:hypothetical protein